jgi:hypothetical protein
VTDLIDRAASALMDCNSGQLPGQAWEGAGEFTRQTFRRQAEAVLAVLQEDVAENRLGGFVRDSATSRKAALANYPRSGSQRARILSRLRILEDEGATRDELAEWFGMSPNSVRPRVAELIEGGWVMETDRTRKTAMGNDAAVLVATDKARAGR